METQITFQDPFPRGFDPGPDPGRPVGPVPRLDSDHQVGCRATWLLNGGFEDANESHSDAGEAGHDDAGRWRLYEKL